MSKVTISESVKDSIVKPILQDIENGVKIYQTRSGGVAMIFTTHAKGEFAEWLGAYYTGTTEDGEWIPCRWHKDGTFPSLNEDLLESGLDLVLPR